MNLDAELTEVFRASCLEQLADIEEHVLGLERLASAGNATDDGGGHIGAIFRAAHSLKADARSMGLLRMSRLAHQTESVLSLVRDERLPVSHGLVDALLAVFDRLRTMAQAPAQAEEIDISEGLAKLCDSMVQALAEGSTGTCVTPTASTASSVCESAPPPTEAPDAGSESTATPADFNAEHIATLSVPASRLDALVDQVGELAVSQASLSGLAHDLGNRRLAGVAEDVERLTISLREQVMALRMLPLKVIFAKFRRLVRDAAKTTGKQVSLDVLGEGVELDKSAIEQLQGPLSHLLRNAVDHGIEPPAERARVGKQAEGRVQLEARQIGGEVEIVVADDGKGMDPEALHQKAVASGLLPADAQLSKQDMLALAFTAGLSTRETISDFSGRGVGMDVVRSNIQQMRGSVELDSTPGQGTRVTLRVPLSLAILDSLQVGAGEGMFFLQLSNVEECFELRRSQAGLIAGFGTATLRGTMLPVVCLREFFEPGQSAPQQPTGALLSDIAPVVVVNAGEVRFGLVVDHIVGHRQAVLKKISRVMGELPAILGGAVLEDGGMGLVLDLPALSRAVHAEHHARQHGCKHTGQQKGLSLLHTETETP